MRRCKGRASPPDGVFVAGRPAAGGTVFFEAVTEDSGPPLLGFPKRVLPPQWPNPEEVDHGTGDGDAALGEAEPGFFDGGFEEGIRGCGNAAYRPNGRMPKRYWYEAARSLQP
ncbi:MAG: hypothetical protein AAGA96_04255 [Verrucomicrobiota bacterium]